MPGRRLARRSAWLFSFLGLLLPSTAQADVVALKRDAGLTAGGAIDPRFADAVVVTTTVSDAGLWNTTSARWRNLGATAIPQAHYNLYKFDLSAIPAGSTIHLAQLRLYHAAGNGTGGNGGVGPILTHDWIEGSGSGTWGEFPGPAGGVSVAHPIGYNTAENRNADNGTAEPWQSWGVTSDQFFSMAGDVGTVTEPSSKPNGIGYHVYDVTTDVQNWVRGSLPNYGWAQVRGNWTFHLSEATNYQPVLFVDYTPASGVPMVSLSIDTTNIAENGGTATLTAALSLATDQVVTVNLTYGGTADLGTDYVADTSIVIQPGELTGQTTITAIDDDAVEGMETLIAEIPEVTNGVEFETQQVTATIVDDDSPSGIVALKRDPGLTAGGAIDPRFNDATVLTTAVGDTSLFAQQESRYRAGGQNSIINGSYDAANYALYKFDLSVIPACAKISLAQLRLYHDSGNSNYGTGGVAMVLTHDWREGPGTGTYGGYPGAAGGVSYAHPIGYHTAPDRNANDGTTPPLQSWGMTHDQFFTWGVDTGPAQAPSSNPGGAGYHVIDVTAHVQAWVSGVKPNYGWAQGVGTWTFHMSEIGSELQPVLFIDYTAAADGTPPAAVEDLAVEPASSSEALTLTWTAPGDDGVTGTATTYEIRYSRKPIDFGNWGAATPVPGVPTPLAAGTSQSVTLSGLAADTVYYFALKTLDDAPNGSALSNIASGRTLADITPPAAVTDLAATGATSDTIVLTWTAPGDDGTIGKAAGYDVRFSTSPITNDADWSNATQAAGEPVPANPGTVQGMFVRDLAQDTAYYLAIRTFDEVGNVSALSNTVLQRTLEDLTPPATIANLAVGKAKSTTLTLTWTAPGDDGASGTATSYDLRYSSDPIDETNWDLATPVTGEPAPQQAGKGQSMVVRGLAPARTYYFAMKTADEVLNVSALSNVATGQTLVDIPINKALLCKDDFEYLGAFALPESVGGAPAGPSGGIALRRVGGQLRLLAGYISTWGNPVVEVAVPDPSTWSSQYPWPKASLVHNWGRSVYGTNTLPYYGNPPGQLNDAWWAHGMTFDPVTNRFYFSWGYWYNVAGDNQNCLAWAELVEGAPVVHGPWKDADGPSHSQRIRSGTTIIPEWFADAYLDGRTLGAGFGGPWSGVAICSQGPYLAAAHHPQDGTNDLDTLELLYYPYPAHYCTRDPNYTIAGGSGGAIGIPPAGDTGYWTNMDNIWGGGAWIDLPDKHGLMYFTWRAHGALAYINGQPRCDWSEPVWMVYDPAELASVAQGQMPTWAPAHDDWVVTYTPQPQRENGYSTTDGVAFDAQTRTLFLKQRHSYKAGAAWYPLIHAWKIKESFQLEGDIDGDGEVSVLDIVAVVTRFGLTPADPDWNDACDFDSDSEISVLDIVFVVTRFGNHL